MGLPKHSGTAIPAVVLEFVSWEGQETNRRRLEHIIRHLEPIYAGWLQKISVSHVNACDGHETAEIDVRPRYKVAFINIFPGFFNSEIERQREILVHELVHSHDGPIISLVQRQILDYVKSQNSDLATAFGNWFDDYLEQSTEDRVRIFLGLLPPLPPMEPEGTE